MKRRTHLTAWSLGLLLHAAARAQVAPQRQPGRMNVGVTPGDPESWAAAQILAVVYEQAGLKPIFVPQPAGRAVLDLVSGVLDANLMRIASFGAMHPQLLRVPTPLYRQDVIVASLPTRNAHVLKREDLKHYTIGAVRGFFFVSELTDGHPSVTLTQGSEQLARMLIAKRIDIALDTALSMRYALFSMGLRDIRVSPALLTLDLYHYLHQRHAALVAPLERILHAMTTRSDLERLARRFDMQALTMQPHQFF